MITYNVLQGDCYEILKRLSSNPQEKRKYRKLLIPHRLALKLAERGYTIREDIIWFKKNNVSSSSKDNFSQAYELILFLSKNEKSFANMGGIRTRGNEAREGRNKTPPQHMMQYEPLK